MRDYQLEYLRLLRDTAEKRSTARATGTVEEYTAAAMESDRASLEAVERGTALLRENLFPVLDDILSAGEEELDDLFEFAGSLMGAGGRDPWLNYRIHLALMDYARHTGRKDMLLRELYHVAMSLYNMEAMLSPNVIRLYTARIRMYFTECASYYGTPYYDECDAETRGYIHRSMGNIALSYVGDDAATAKAKLEAITRSIGILSDPDVRAKTPELPWDTYLYKSHQERTSLLSFLRSGKAGPETFAQVMESAQIVQSRQLAAFRERGVQPEPRWQYAYMAALYHCGAMLLTEFLDGLSDLSSSRPMDDFGPQGIFAYVSAPAYYLRYSAELPENAAGDAAMRIRRMTARLRAYIYALPAGENRDDLLFSLRQFLYVYREVPGGAPFAELLQDVFASRNPTGYVRMYLTGRIAQELTGWALEDCPEKLTGLAGTEDAAQVRARREELLNLALRAGRLTDVGMLHFFQMDSSACRGLFEEEETVIHLHAHLGAELLGAHASTADLADIALGRHLAFDERGGYPVDFSLRGKASRPMSCLVSVADTLASTDPDTAARSLPYVPFDEALERIRSGAGTVYAPFAAALLDRPDRLERLRRGIPAWKREALSDIYRRASEARGAIQR